MRKHVRARVSRRMRASSLLTIVAAASLLAAPPAHAANSVPTWDRHFLLETAEGAHFEIDMGRVAARHARTAEGRALGRLMVKDHSGELHAVQQLADGLHVSLPHHPSAAQRHDIRSVAAHTGMAFDRAYARLEIADHIVDVQSADGELMEGTLEPLKPFAAKYRQTYLRHLAAFRLFADHVHP
jgi:putative membrane protein